MSADIAKLVQADIETRASFGERKYGVRLHSFNGRDALIDAYQESIDLCKYLRQEIEERYGPDAKDCSVAVQPKPKAKAKSPCILCKVTQFISSLRGVKWQKN